MYVSPIGFTERMFEEKNTSVTQLKDRLVIETVTEIGVVVNKEELIKALKYDRDQYEKGYRDGYLAAQRELEIFNKSENMEL